MKKITITIAIIVLLSYNSIAQDCQKQCDSLRHELVITNFKIRRQIGYINIVIKNPSQIKFLKGWSIRDGIYNTQVYRQSIIPTSKHH